MLSGSNAKVGTIAPSVRARINLAPTQQVKNRIAVAGFTPARTGRKYLKIAQFRNNKKNI